MWRIHKAAGKPFPDLTDDPVMNYLITEAVALKVQRLDREAEEKAHKDVEMKRKKEEAKKELAARFGG